MNKTSKKQRRAELIAHAALGGVSIKDGIVFCSFINGRENPTTSYDVLEDWIDFVDSGFAYGRFTEILIRYFRLDDIPSPVFSSPSGLISPFYVGSAHNYCKRIRRFRKNKPMKPFIPNHLLFLLKQLKDEYWLRKDLSAAMLNYADDSAKAILGPQSK